MPTQSEIDEYWGRFKPRGSANSDDLDYNDPTTASDESIEKALRYWEQIRNERANRPWETPTDEREGVTAQRVDKNLKAFRAEYDRRGMRKKNQLYKPEAHQSTTLGGGGSRPFVDTFGGGGGGQKVDAPTPKPWGVGAMGTSRLGMNPKYLMALLGNEQENKQKSFADQQFESQLALSGMSPADQQMARMFRNSPAIAKVMADSRGREETQKWRTEDREDRQRQAEEMLKERQRVSDEQRAAIAEMKKAERERMIAGAAGSRTVSQFDNPAFAHPAAVTPQMDTGRMNANQMGPQRARQGIGGPKTVHEQGAPEVGTMPDAYYDYLMKEDPSNPALQGTIPEKEYNRLRMRDKAETDKRRQEEAIKDERSKRIESARAWIKNASGIEATDTDLAEFESMMQDPTAKIEVVAANIAKRKKAEAAKAEREGNVEAGKAKTGSEKNRKELRDLAASYNKALTIYNDTDGELDAKAKLAAKAALQDAGDKLKAEGVEPPADFKPVDIYQFKKKEGLSSAMSNSIPKAAGAPKISPEALQGLQDEMNDPTTPDEDKAKIKAILDQNVSAKPETIADDQAMGDLRLTGMHPAPEPKPNVESGPQSDNDLRQRQRVLYAEIAFANSKKQDVPQELLDELNRIDATLKRRGYESFHAKGITGLR